MPCLINLTISSPSTFCASLWGSVLVFLTVRHILFIHASSLQNINNKNPKTKQKHLIVPSWGTCNEWDMNKPCLGRPVRYCKWVGGAVWNMMVGSMIDTWFSLQGIQRYNMGSNQYVNKHINICCATGCISECICWYLVNLTPNTINADEYL